MDEATKFISLEVTQEEREKIRQQLDLDENKIRRSLHVIKEWVKKEEHLANAFNYLDDNIIERMYLNEKGSVERTKIRVDKFLTCRRMLPELCLNKTIDEFEDLMEKINLLPLRNLNPSDLSRVIVVRQTSENGNNVDLMTYLRYAFLVIDYTMKMEYDLGERYVLDLKHFNMTGVSKLHPLILKKAEVLSFEGYGLRIRGIHLINTTTIVDLVISVIKKIIRGKVARRLHVHNSFEDLHKEIAKEILPKDYGGDLSTCSEVTEQWKNTLKADEARKITENFNQLVSDDSKRSCYKFNEEYLGMPGSFSQLVVD